MILSIVYLSFVLVDKALAAATLNFFFLLKVAVSSALFWWRYF